MMENTNNAIEAKSAIDVKNASFKEILEETDGYILNVRNKLGRIIEGLASPERSDEKSGQEDLCMRDTLLRQHENAVILLQMVLKLEEILF